ncbi:MAG: homocysteine S-methyltransferase family protein [Lachnospiraceae bacterium]|nr:homocysteine S-methyltransferase family protein [Lachnospiraceae bacterium]
MNFFEQKFGNRIIFLDGATGSNLALRGMPAGVCPEQWILEHEDVLIGLQKEYVNAGTDILYAPTFGGNRIKLAEYGLEDKLVEMNTSLVKIARKAAGDKTLVAGDITMTGKQLYPVGDMQFEELVTIYKEQIAVLAEAGCDLIVIETMMSLQETRAAVIAAKETCDLPVIATLSFEGDGKTLYGTDAVTAALVLEGLGVDAVGINCSTGPEQMKHLVKSMSENVSVPVIAKPNAGMPTLDEGGKTVYSMNADEFAKQSLALIEAGAGIVGGCCGTTPEHIAALHSVCTGMKRPMGKVRDKRVLTSEHKTITFGLDDPFLVIGERINPTGKKALQAELREGKLDMIVNFAVEQEEKGADILDINLGMGGIDENDMLLKTVYEVMGVSHLPLSIDSSKCEVVENALRIYPGRALVNSVSMEEGKAEKLFPLIKKYGAMFILLPLSDAGLPKNLDEKINIIETLLNKAYSYGLTNNDIVVDGLVTTVSANEKAALETLETIRYCKSKGLATVCGLSNISFGLPERSNVNTAFLTMAISQGLTMAIANPSQKELMNAIYATDMLLNKKDAGLRYINKMTGVSDASDIKNTETQKESHEKIIHRAVLRGNVSGMVALTETAMQEGGLAADYILNQCLLPAINEVGDLFNTGKYFLPQLIASANAMKAAIEYLEPYLQKDSSGENAKTVIIATVKGDIHDIGKNLVALMLKNYGYQVIDLGKDVPTEEIIAKAKETNAEIIALSALMTTTMVEMKHVISAAREAGLSSKIMVGGAVITQEYADEILADGYSKDAAGAVKTAERLTF